MMRTILLCVCALALLNFCAPSASEAQRNQTGAVKGKVRNQDGSSIAGVTVTARQGERDVASVTTNRSGEFLLGNLTPGSYTLVFRKTGLSVGTMQNVEVSAGKTRSLRDRLVLPIDEGSLAYVRGGVFDADGRSVRGAIVEIARVAADGSARRIDSRISNSVGEFSFSFTPDRAIYRVTAKRSGAQPVTKDVEVDGAMVYRIALTLRPQAAN